MDTFTQTKVTRVRTNGEFERFTLSSERGESLDLSTLSTGVWSLTKLVDGQLVTEIYPTRAFVGARITQEPVEVAHAVEPAMASA